jgi:type IV pilus assembly protein PilQ
MKLKNKNIALIALLILSLSITGVKTIIGQDHRDQIQHQLDSIASIVPGLSQSVDFSVNNLPIQELIRTIAVSNKINVVIDPSLEIMVTNNFVDVPAKDVFLYLCDTYHLDLIINGKILSFILNKDGQIKPPAKDLDIFYDTITQMVSMNLRNDSLEAVCRTLTELSKKNILLMPETRDKKVSIFIKNVPLENAVANLAITNQLLFEAREGAYILSENAENPRNRDQGISTNEGFLSIEVSDRNHISVTAENAPLNELIQEVSSKSGVDFFIYSEIEGQSDIYLENARYEDFLRAVFNTTLYTYTVENGIYLIGERQSEILRDTKVIQLNYRSSKDIMAVIPENLKEGITLVEFIELNSIILSGSKRGIEEIAAFIIQIDKVVPLITIDVIIVDNRSGFNVATGINMGVGDQPVNTQGQVFSGVDMSIGAETINQLINSFSGFGSVNLGNVTPNFYVSLKFMEEQGIIKVRSTPKLSTLNGHEASIIIGETDYYVKESTDFIVNASTSQTTTKQFESVKAEFSLVITPFVSGDEQITLDVEVKQSTFTTRIAPEAPPGQLSRDFSSKIRVRNNEMILLGGLEISSLNETSKGMPWISRVPILKWIFSTRERKTENDKLNIFIRPTIIY